ncbi:hypothetical protein K220099C10_19700 [Bacteroides thetaiotaomicron]|jgi:hypothetical protein|nr:MAG: hypothetical protein OGM04_12045 [Bacteroides ovatus]
MKNRTQILSFIKTIKPKTVVDKKKIIQYCSQMGIQFAFNANNDDLKRTTFKEFLTWANNDSPEIGKILVYPNPFVTIGIVSMVTPEQIYLGPALFGEDGLVINNVEKPTSGYREATEQETLKLHQVLLNKGFCWNLWQNKFVKSIYIPRQNQFVRFRSYTTNHEGVGIFKKITDTGDIVMYCVKSDNSPIQYSLHEVIGKKDCYQFAAATKKDIRALKDELYQVGKIWNGYYSRIQPVEFFVNNGEEYCYISDKGKIEHGRRNNSIACKERIAFGNIFADTKQAEDFLRKVQEIIKSELCKPTVEGNALKRIKEARS